MARFLKDRIKLKGLAPGSLVLVGEQKMEAPELSVIYFDKDTIEEKPVKTIDEALPYTERKGVTWINLYGIHDFTLMRSIGDIFNLPNVLLENLMNTDIRPKYETGPGFDAVILKMLGIDNELNVVQAEQMGLLFTDKIVFTIQEKRGDVFEGVRQRLRNSSGKIRSNSTDYLAYALMDSVIDNYFFLIEELGDRVESLDEIIFHSVEKDTLERIYTYKNELHYLRKSIRPVKDVMLLLLKSASPRIKENNRQFYSDLNGLVLHINEALDLYNIMITDLLNIYRANMDSKMNQVMKVLTIFASIFIPLTFLAGIYGMNFDNIPELHYKFAYPIFWGVSVLIVIIMIIYFKRKKWL